MSLAPLAGSATPNEQADLQHYLAVIRRRKGVCILAFGAALALGVGVAGMVRPVYRTTAKVVVPVPVSPKAYRPQADDSIFAIEAAAAAQPPSLTAQADEMMSDAACEAAMRAAGLPVRADKKRPKVKVEAPDLGDADVITITVEDTDAGAAAALANEIGDLHVERMQQYQTAGLRKATQFMRRERDQAAQRLVLARQALMSFRREHPLALWTAKQEVQSKQLSELQSRVIEARSAIASIQGQLPELRARLHKEQAMIPAEQTRDNPQRAELEEKIRQLRIQRVELLNQFQPDSPQIQEIDEQIDSFNKQLEAEPRTVTVRAQVPNPARAVLEPKVADLDAALVSSRENYRAAVIELAKADRPMRDVGPAQLELEGLTQEAQRAQDRYNQLSDRLQVLEIRGSTQTNTARVIDRASVPESPVLPSRGLLLGLAAISALFVALGSAFVQEMLDDRVMSPEDLERAYALPTLGSVPPISADHPKLAATLPDDPRVIEAYRGLHSSIGFAGIDAPIRRLQVTSPQAGDGKTMTAMNLALAMALDGKRVILVDADLRRPTLHELVNVPNAPGLTDVLMGLSSVEEALQPTDVANLKILCAGPAVPNPGELFGSSNFEYVIEHLEYRADVVIFDTSPCVPVADPLLVGARMDGVVLVVHAGKTRRAAVKQATDMLQRARARVIGVVYNRLHRPRNSATIETYYFGNSYFSGAAQRSDLLRRNGRMIGAGAVGTVDEAEMEIMEDLN